MRGSRHQEGSEDEGERVVHVVPHARFENGEHVRRYPRPQPVGPERAERDGGEAGEGAEEQKGPVD